MVRIRKKTSNRQSTTHRKSIQKKVRESRKKKSKEAKKNTQWKSKHKKDPGIPSNYPYKDRILAEIAEERRATAEEKARKKAEKNVAKGITQDATPDVDTSEALDTSGQGFDGVASLRAKTIKKPKPTKVVEVGPDEDEVPAFMVSRELPNLKSVLDIADIVIQVLDCRDPYSFRSSHLEAVCKEKKDHKVVFLLNKIDTCPREAVEGWMKHLSTDFPTFPFRSSSSCLPVFLPVPATKGKGKAVGPSDDALGEDAVLDYLKAELEQSGKNELTIAVVGVTNVGKSSFINSLIRKRSIPIYEAASSSQGPSTTEAALEVAYSIQGDLPERRLRFIDTPGYFWVAPDKSSGELDSQVLLTQRVKDILLRNKGRIDRLKDPMPPVELILSRANNEDLMLLYCLPSFSKGDVKAFLTSCARAQQHIKKGGDPDISSAARLILRDWMVGKLLWYTTPPQVAAEANDLSKREVVLNSLPLRKEMRAKGGLVRLSIGVVEDRQLALEQPFRFFDENMEADDSDVASASAEEHEGVDDNAESGSEDGAEDEDGMSEAEVSDEESENDEDTAPPGKRKRGVPQPVPRKKVAFVEAEKPPRRQSGVKGRQPKALKRRAGR